MKTSIQSNQIRYLVLALSGGLAMVSCESENGEDVEALGSAEHEIINGTVVTTDLHFTPRLLSAAGNCSGTMIGDQWVLTAHHCVTHDALPTGGTAVPDSGVIATLLDGTSSRSVKIYRHPTLDVALVQLANPLVPVGTKPVALYRDVVAVVNGTGVFCQGWGLNTVNSGSGTLRSANLMITNVSGSGYVVHRNDQGQIPWSGDSGSACFSDNQALGVASTCTPIYDAQNNIIGVSSCYYTSADHFYDWAMTTMGKVVSGIPGKCLDLQAGNTANGTAAQLYYCNGAQGQTWTPLSDGTIRAFGRCLDVKGGATAGGTLVQLWDCNGTGSQQWTQRDDGTLMNPQSGRCLGVPAGATTGQVQILDCTTGIEQRWTLTTRTKTVAATSIGDLCMDVRNGSNASGTAVQTAACNGNASQNWTIAADGTLRAFGKCLDVVGGATGNGALLQLWDCNGTGAQQWSSRTDRSLYNPQSDRCVDIPNASGTPGTQLQIYDCNGTNAQVWTFKNVAKTIVLKTGNLCMDVRNGSSASGAAVQVYTCNGSNAQKWTLEADGTIRSLGKCLDVVGGATGNGALLQLWDCNGTGAQQWLPIWDGPGRIFNPQSIRVIDDPNASTTPGTRLQIYDYNGTTAQDWAIQ